MSEVQITKQGIVKADGTEATSTSKVYARAQSSSALNIDYTLGFIETGSQTQISKSSIEANQFYEI